MMPTFAAVKAKPELPSGEEECKKPLKGPVEVDPNRKTNFGSGDNDHASVGSEPELGVKIVDTQDYKGGYQREDSLLLDQSEKSSSPGTCMTSSSSVSGSELIQDDLLLGENASDKKKQEKSEKKKDKEKESGSKKKQRKRKKKYVDDENQTTATARDEQLVEELCGSELIQEDLLLQENASDKKKKKKGKKKKTKRKKKSADDENQTTVTARDEQLVEELCGFLSNTLSTSQNTKSFLRLLKKTAGPQLPDQQSNARHDDLGYTSNCATLQPHHPSACGSHVSHLSAPSIMHATEVQRTAAGAPSISQMPYALNANSTHTSQEPKISFSSPDQNHTPKLVRGSLCDTISMSTSVQTTKRSNCQNDATEEECSQSSRSQSVFEQPIANEFSRSPSTENSSPPSAGRRAESVSKVDQGRQTWSVSEESSLCIALPQEFRSYLLGMFRSYLLGLHAEEVQHDQQHAAEDQWREEQLLMSGHPKSAVPAETRRDQDAQSVISALSGFSGMVLNIATARIKPPVYFIGRDHGNDDTSDASASDDSDDESSGPNLPDPSIVSQDFSGHQKHAEEVQHDQQHTDEGHWREEQLLLMSGHQMSVVPAETRRDRDAQSVISALSGFSGMVLNIVGRDHGNDDSSDSSDDSDDESLGPDLPEPSIVSQDFSRHQKQPRCSSMASIAPSECLSRQQQLKTVDFSFVHIREYDTVLDTNPAVTKGPAIALGWNLLAEHVLLVNDHDKGHRRYGEALMLSTHTRQGILQKMGYSQADIDQSIRRLRNAQSQRRRTVQNVRMQNLEFAMERVGKRFKHLLRRRPQQTQGHYS